MEGQKAVEATTAPQKLVPVEDDDLDLDGQPPPGGEVTNGGEAPQDKPAEKPSAAMQRLPASGGDDVPEWALVPKDLRVPKGRQVVFLRFPAALTVTPHKGERQCIVWTLSDGDEKQAAQRCQGDSNRAGAEYPKQMLRAVDGCIANWSKARGPGSIDEFWAEIGPKGRNLLMRVYTQLHMASEDELADFFKNCVAVRSSA